MGLEDTSQRGGDGGFYATARGRADFETLRGRLRLHTRAARNFLDALVALGFLQREDGQYANTAETDFFLDKGKPTYLGGILEMSNNRLFGFWKDLTPALRTGMPQNEAKTGEEPFFTVLCADPQRLKEFLRAMSGLSRPANLAIARQLPWEKYAAYVDVGTAQGDLAVQIALGHSHLTGIGFDLPEVGPVFPGMLDYARPRAISGPSASCYHLDLSWICLVGPEPELSANPSKG